jgi:hypothetical protein
MAFEFTPELQQAISQDPVAFARDSASAPEILEELGAPDRIDSIRQFVASNPSTPIRILLKLMADFPHEVLNNTTFLLLQLEHLNLLDEISDDILEEVLRHDNSPLVLVNHAAKFRRDAYVVNALLANHLVSVCHLEILIERFQDDEINATKIIRHPKFTDRMKREIARCDNECLQMALINYCFDFAGELPIELLKCSIDHASPRVLIRVATSPKITDELADYLFSPERDYIKIEIMKRFEARRWKLPKIIQSRLH